MAIVIRNRGLNKNLGRIVTCVQFVGQVSGFSGDDLWMTKEPLRWSGKDEYFCPDSVLKPIRPGDLHETEDDLNEVPA